MINFKNIVKVGGWTLVSRILGLFRDVLLARYLGASGISDAFFVALKIPNLFRKLFAEGAMQSAFIPTFTKLLNINEKEAKLFANQVFSILLIALIIFVLIIEIFTPYVINIISPGFKNRGEEIFNLTVLLVRITIPYLFFVSIVAFFSSILNSISKFALVAFLPAFLNIAMIACLLFDFMFPNAAIAVSIGVFLGGVMQLLVVAYSCYKKGWMTKIVFIFKLHAETKSFLKKLLPVVIGAGVYQVNIVVDIIAASLLEEGAISYLFYADRIYQLPLAMIGIATATVLLPAISGKLANQKIQADKIKEQAILIAFSFAIFATIGIMLFAEVIIKSIFLGGGFLTLAVDATSIVLFIYAISLPVNVLIKVLLPFYYAEGDTKTPFYSTLVCLFINIIMVLLLTKYFGYAGIAFATVVASIVNFIILVVVFHKKYGFTFSAVFLSELKKIAFIAIILFVFLYGIILIYNSDSLSQMQLRFYLATVVIFAIGFVFMMLKITNSVIYKQIFKFNQYK